MAGIFEGVASDIAKLKELKREIESVKESLKGVNIKVDIDIKDGLETKLKALLGQSEALTKKIAEAEGKAAAMMQKMQNETAKMTSATIKRTDDPYAKSSSEDIKVQVQTYNELKREMESVIGTRRDNAQTIVNETIAIQQLKEEMKNINKSIQENGTATAGQRARLAEINDEIETHKVAMSEAQQVLKAQTKLDNAATTSMKGLAQQLAQMKTTYRELTAEERESPFGNELLASIEAADAQLKELDASIGNFQRNVGNYPEEFGGQIANLLGLNGQLGDALVNLGKSGAGEFFSGLQTKVAAFGKTAMTFLANPAFLAFVGLAAAAKAFKWWYDYNQGLIEASRLTTQFTGLTGDSMKAYRNEVTAISDTYGKDFKEVMIATNAVSKQFGISSSQALKLVRDGFVSGADANGEFLDNLKEYPAYFKEAGLTASEFIAITTQANKSGVYSDKGIDVIKEGNIRIREMTAATAKALDGLGINSKKVQKDLAEGKKTTFDVIKEVSGEIKKLPGSSQAVGRALADIFGGPGEDAGVEYIKMLAEMDTNLDNVKDKAGRLAEIEEEQIKASAELNNLVSSLFDQTGGTFEEMTASFKLFGTQVLNKCIKGLVDIINYFIDLYNESTAFRVVVEAIKLAWNNTVDGIATTWDALVKLFKAGGKTLKGALTWDWKLWKEGVKETANTYAEFFKKLSSVGNKNREEFFKNISDSEKKEHFTIPALTVEEESAVDKDEEDKKKPLPPSEEEKKAAKARKEAAEELAKYNKDLQKRVTDATLAAMEDGTEKEIAQIKESTKKKVEELERQAKEMAKKQAKAKGTNEDKELAKIQGSAEYKAAHKSITDEGMEAEAKARMKQYQTFIQAYGTFEQKRYEIAQRYAKKIAGLQGLDKEMAIRQRDEELASVNAQALSVDIDWANVFGDLGGMMTEQLQSLLAQLQEYTKTDEFKNAGSENQKTIMDAISQIKEKVGGGAINKETFAGIGTALDDLKKKSEEVEAARNAEKEAYDKLREAQEKLIKATTDAEKAAAETAVKEAEQNAQQASTNVVEAEENYKNAQNELTDKTKQAKSAMEGFANGLSEISGGSLTGAMEGLRKVLVAGGLDATSKLAQALSGSGTVGMIVQAALSILDILETGIGNIISGLIDKIFTAITNLIEDVLGFGIIKKVGKALYEGITGVFESLFKALSFGLFDGNLSGSNAEEVAKTIDRLTDRNERLTESIDNLTEEMEKSRGAKSVVYYNEAVAYQEEKQQNLQDIAKAQAGYHNAHHSWNYYWGGLSEEEIEKVEKLIGRKWSGNLWDLSPEEMKMLLSLPDIVEKISRTGEGGYGERVLEKLEDYAAEAGKLEELTSSLNEALTGVSFDSFYNSYVSMLQNVDRKNKEMADNFKDYLYNALVANFVGEEMEEAMKAWYERWSAAMKDGSINNREVRDALMKEYQDIVNRGDEKARELEEMVYGEGGKTANAVDQGTKGSFEGMSQETADELNGRFTALQIAGERVAESTSIMAQTMAEMKVMQSLSQNIAEESQTILANSYLELQGINTNTKSAARSLLVMEERLTNIERKL